MKRHRNLGIFLLAVSFLIPWNVAYLYQEYYMDVDFLVRKHFSADEEDELLNLFKQNSRVLVPPGQPIQQAVISFSQAMFCQPNPFLPADPKHPVLRC